MAVVILRVGKDTFNTVIVEIVQFLELVDVTLTSHFMSAQKENKASGENGFHFKFKTNL